MATFFLDLRYGIRLLLKNTGPTAVATLSLALGIGANSTIFSLVDGAFLRPLPVDDPESLIAVYSTSERRAEDSLSYPEFLDICEQASVFRGAAVWGKRGGIISVRGEGEMVGVDVVSPEYFPVLGVRPHLGQAFMSRERDDSDNPQSIVISFSLWQRRLGASLDAVGKTVLLSGKHMTVVGVAPRQFRGLDRNVPTDVWISPSGWSFMTGSRPEFTKRDNRWLHGVARLVPGASMEAVRTQLTTIAGRLTLAYPATNKNRGFSCTTEAERQQRIIGQVLFPMAMVSLVLLIACANVANLLLAQMERRRRELAMRMALGAGRGRLIGQLLTEGTLLALLGGSLSLLLSSWLIRLIPSFMPPGPIQIGPDVRLDGRVLIFTALASLFTALLFGLIPAYQASKCEPNSVMKGDEVYRGGASQRLPIRHLLVVAEIALSMILMVGAGLLLRSLWQSLNIRPGFDKGKEMLLLRVAPPQSYGYNQQQASEFLQSLIERIRALPGVKRASYARRPPMAGYEGGEVRKVVIPGYQLPPGEELLGIRYNIVATGFFQTMGTAILRGRDFEGRDAGAGVRIVIVNETMAQRYWPNEDAVGKWLRIGQDDFQVTGVVEDGKYVSIHEAAQPYMFFPFSQMFSSSASLFVETAGDARLMVAPILQESRALNENIPVVGATTLKEHMDFAMYTDRLGAQLVGGLGLLGIFLAAAGLYGVVSYLVNRRTREIGIRMALGARPADVLQVVVGQGFRLIMAGLILGTGVALIASRFMSSMLFGVKPTDALAFAGAACLVAAVSLLACVLPARRATMIAPMTALRHE